MLSFLEGTVQGGGTGGLADGLTARFVAGRDFGLGR